MHLNYHGLDLHIQKLGQGNKVMLLFHGYGQSGNVFEEFTLQLSDKYTFYIFDLPFHGDSKFDENIDFDHDFWYKVLIKFVTEQKINKFEVLGFSLGGLFALSTYQAMPTRVENFILIAPDGIRKSFWQSIFTKNAFTLLLFKFVLNNWSFFSLVPRIFSSMGLISKPLNKFVLFHLDSKNKRDTLYKCWKNFRKLQLDLDDIALQIRKHYTEFNVFTGKNDKVIKSAYLIRFLKKTKRYNLVELEASHGNILKKSLDYMVDSQVSVKL